jgi:hypothetical protein
MLTYADGCLWEEAGVWLQLLLQDSALTAQGNMMAWLPEVSHGAPRETLVRRFVVSPCDETWQVLDDPA